MVAAEGFTTNNSCPLGVIVIYGCTGWPVSGEVNWGLAAVEAGAPTAVKAPGLTGSFTGAMAKVKIWLGLGVWLAAAIGPWSNASRNCPLGTMDRATGWAPATVGVGVATELGGRGGTLSSPVPWLRI